jgi:hypothetical protein
VTLEGLVVNRYPTRRTMSFGTLKDWTWCEHCLEWKDAAGEVTFIEMKEDVYGKDLLTFACDTCHRETANALVISSPNKPRR